MMLNFLNVSDMPPVLSRHFALFTRNTRGTPGDIPGGLPRVHFSVNTILSILAFRRGRLLQAFSVERDQSRAKGRRMIFIYLGS